MNRAVAAVDTEYLMKRGWPVPKVGTERRVARLLASWRVEPPVLQFAVGQYRLDFAWPQYRIAVEVDGWHHDRPEQLMRDAQRQRALVRAGWIVLHVDPDSESCADLLVNVARFIGAAREIVT